MSFEHRTVIFGIDGAHFELIRPWINEGKLPNLRALFADGVTADLESVLPPVTSPNWKAYATGRNPARFGIYWWENVNPQNRRIYYPHERKQTLTEYWELLADDSKVGVMGVPTTYPPKSTGEFYVSGAPDAPDNGYTYPPELEDELKRRFDYQVTLNARLKDNIDTAAKEIIDGINVRLTAARSLFEEYDLDFMQVTTFYINSLHHYLWDHEYTLDAWQVVDEHVGYFLERDMNVVLMSDHGSTPIDEVFYVNAWLEEQGYLVTTDTWSNRLHRIGITTDRLVRIANSLGVRSLAESLAPSWLVNRIPNDQGQISRERKTDHIDWENSSVVASGQGPVYILETTDTTDDTIRRDELVTSLEALNGPSGYPIAEAVHNGEDVYAGRYVDDAPEIVIDQRTGVHISGSIGADSVFADPAAEGWCAENKRHGLFAAAGPEFRDGEADTLSILDLAPTMLHLFGQAIPTDYDGEVRKDLFTPKSGSHSREIKSRTMSPQRAELARMRAAARTIKDNRGL